MQTALYCSELYYRFSLVLVTVLTISGITSRFCAFIIINRKMAVGDVMGGFPNPRPTGYPPFIFI